MIELINISKSFENKKIFDNFSLHIEDNEMVAITGPSGSGKTTLLNIIGLLESFDSGNIIIDGQKNIYPNTTISNKIIRDKICYLFQNFALVDDETVDYNLELALKYRKENKKEKLILKQNALKKVGLDGFLKKKIYTLSGGEQQRVSIARAILKPNKIILADEPTGSLDESNKLKIIDLLYYLKSTGKTIVIVTHDTYLSECCDRTIKI